MRPDTDCGETERGCEGGGCGKKCLWSKTWQPLKKGNTVESCIGWWSHHHQFSPHTPTLAAEQ